MIATPSQFAAAEALIAEVHSRRRPVEAFPTADDVAILAAILPSFLRPVLAQRMDTYSGGADADAQMTRTIAALIMRAEVLQRTGLLPVFNVTE